MSAKKPNEKSKGRELAGPAGAIGSGRNPEPGKTRARCATATKIDMQCRHLTSDSKALSIEIDPGPLRNGQQRFPDAVGSAV
jgi:hypothetical protein